MLTTRNVVTLVIAVSVISLVSACVSLVGSPTSGVTGRDSYGTHAYGYRGLFETLEALHVPVEREIVPPDGLARRELTLAIFEPDPVILTSEPAYLRRVAAWVEEGGAVVVAPSVARPRRLTWPLQDWPPKSPLEELSLSQIDTDVFHSRSEALAEDDEDKSPNESKKAESAKARRSARQIADQALDLALGQAADVPVSFVKATVDGDLAARFPRGLELAVPAKGLRVITELGRIKGSHVRAILEPGGEPQILAALYPRERGSIAVVADARLAQNSLVCLGDNAVLLAHLLADPRYPVVFDEFYHGRTVRSNPLWLATRFPYNALALTTLGVTLLVGWRAARALGPPIPRRVPSRRTLTEYIEAMARLLNRSRRPSPYLLNELRQGLLWRVRRELNQPPGLQDTDKLLQVLGRRDPLLADRLKDALQAIDQTLQSPSLDSTTMKATLAKVSRCAAVPRRIV
jgi:Domain of unknown function (DUF4350)